MREVYGVKRHPYVSWRVTRRQVQNFLRFLHIGPGAVPAGSNFSLRFLHMTRGSADAARKTGGNNKITCRLGLRQVISKKFDQFTCQNGHIFGAQAVTYAEICHMACRRTLKSGSFGGRFFQISGLVTDNSPAGQKSPSVSLTRGGIHSHCSLFCFISNIQFISPCKGK